MMPGAAGVAVRERQPLPVVAGGRDVEQQRDGDSATFDLLMSGAPSVSRCPGDSRRTGAANVIDLDGDELECVNEEFNPTGQASNSVRSMA